jgi:hypothetical protein
MTTTRGAIAQRYLRSFAVFDREYPSGVPSSKSGSSGGRVTPSQKQVAQSRSGRYTPPIPRESRHSPGWFPFVIIGLLVVGLIVIIGNYAGAMPGGTHDWYLIGGIAAIIVGLVLATYYH